MNILCIGDLSLDEYKAQDQYFFGGCSLNVARQLFEVLNHKETALYIPLGDDEASVKAQAFLEELSIEVRIKRFLGPLPRQPIEIDLNGERHFDPYVAGVLPKFKATDLGGFYLDSKDLIIFPYFKEVEPLVKSLLSLAPKAKLACDFGNLSDYDGNLTHIKELLPFLSYAQFSGTPSSKFRDEFFSKAALDHELLIIDTFGKDGVKAYKGPLSLNCPAPAVTKVIDTTGAGDAFMAHITYSYFVEGNDLEAALNFACKGGAQQISHLGPGPK